LEGDVLNAALTVIPELIYEVLQADLDFFFGQLVAAVLDHFVDCPPCAPESGCLSLAGLS
jgi:hypothetical protein